MGLTYGNIVYLFTLSLEIFIRHRVGEAGQT